MNRCLLIVHALSDGVAQTVPVGAVGGFREEVDLGQLLADGRRYLCAALVQQADDHTPIPHGTVVNLVLGAVEQGGFTQLTAAVDDVGAVGVQDAVQLLPATHEHLRRHGGAGDLIGVEPPEGQCRLEQSLHALHLGDAGQENGQNAVDEQGGAGVDALPLEHGGDGSAFGQGEGVVQEQDDGVAGAAVAADLVQDHLPVGAAEHELEGESVLAQPGAEEGDGMFVLGDAVGRRFDGHRLGELLAVQVGDVLDVQVQLGQKVLQAAILFPTPLGAGPGAEHIPGILLDAVAVGVFRVVVGVQVVQGTSGGDAIGAEQVVVAAQKLS